MDFLIQFLNIACPGFALCLFLTVICFSDDFFFWHIFALTCHYNFLQDALSTNYLLFPHSQFTSGWENFLYIGIDFQDPFPPSFHSLSFSVIFAMILLWTELFLARSCVQALTPSWLFVDTGASKYRWDHKGGPCIVMTNVLTGRDTRKRSFSLCHVRTRKENSYLEGRQALTGVELAGNFECFIFRLLVA